METYASKEAVAFAMWRIIRDTTAANEIRSVDQDLALYARCREAVESKKPMHITLEAAEG